MKRIILVLAALAAIAGCKTKPDGPEPTKVLMIGNSFSISLMTEMPKVAKALGDDLDLTSLYIGGCSLKRHVQNLKKANVEDFAPYKMSRNVRGKAKPDSRVNLPEVLMDEETKYDIITIQQSSRNAWEESSYHPWGEQLLAAIRKYQPKAKIYVQETWSYTPWDRRLEKWGMNQQELYAQLHIATEVFAKANGLGIIPMGTAVQEWRKQLPVKYTDHSLGGDVVGGRYQKEKDRFNRNPDLSWSPNCDLCHLNESGEYLQALVWTRILFGESIAECDYKPESVPEKNADLMKSIADKVGAEYSK